MRRWGLVLAAVAGLMGVPKPSPAANLTVVLEAEIVTLDPHYIGAYITRTFGYAVFDTLFAPDGNFNYRPQMVQSHTVSPDGLTWTFTLRDGLLFHDGSPVTSADVVASLRRWSTRAALGGRLMAATQTLEAVDAKTFRLVLKEPYGLVIETLGTMASPTPFIMPSGWRARPARSASPRSWAPAPSSIPAPTIAPATACCSAATSATCRAPSPPISWPAASA